MLRIGLLVALLVQVVTTSVPAQGAKAASAKQKSRPSVLPATYTGRQIMVGGGGGFTGLVTTYYLLDNGRLYRKTNRDASYKLINTQKATTTKRIFTTAENQCRIKTTHYDKPGNVSRFVGWRKGKQSYRVTWAAGDSTVPASYPSFYTTFMAMIPASARSN